MGSKVVPDRILIVCDEVNMQAFFQEALGQEGDKVVFTSSDAEALRRLESEWFDFVFVDFNIPGLDGRELLQQAKTLRPTTRCMAFRAHEKLEPSTVPSQRRAYEYPTRLAHHAGLSWGMEKASDVGRPARNGAHSQGQAETRGDFANIVGESVPMRHLFRLIKVVADTNSTVLIQGETGTGKELVARAIHEHSPRQPQAFVAIDCGALPEPLLESELFGHVRGAFTGAISSQRGLFQEAHEGTLLLDEIGNTTLPFQAKLLRVLQEGEIRPVGGNRSVKVDVRVLASTNQDLNKAMEEQTFRKDLYYRLAVVPVVLPPLRQRREDIPLLVEHFLRKYCQRNRLEPKWVSAEALELLVNASWPGNVRELEHVIERAVVLSRGAVIQLADLASPALADSPPLGTSVRYQARLEAAEQAVLRQALQEYGGDKRAAARALGIALSTLYEKLKRYQLSPALPAAPANLPT